ncbi:metallopeptidase family protein [Tsuneonella flava]|uniref:Metallopeptidase family protein n=1 Tax=Tsuneonella flava TaxID=2055955 RepID=A0ABX7KAZ1_9SPHN|nr:metallopeptidase family protein [Tsuneonella flava]QSB44221.1 metallopeptidase family protein [Tsuneonella flava]
MTRTFRTPPSPAEFEAIALAALNRIPAPFRDHLGDIILLVEEFADAETLAELGIDDPYQLTGLFEGIGLTDASISDSGQMPNRVRLFRQPILDEWIANGEDLEHLVAHVVIHEIGHHFGLSDADMHALEEQARQI